jgi:D-glycero-alpha-D-manno-heptose 1-phosphate guanylyltransferase
MDITEYDAAILCGGLGKRLRSVVSDRPKPMAEIGKTPFLELLIKYLASQGLRRFILCTGYMGERVEEYFSKKVSPFQILFSKEEKLLGTAGAVKNASSFIRSDPFFVFNGDSICRVSIKEFLHFHKVKDASCSIVLTKTFEGKDYGNVKIDEEGRIISFNEKSFNEGAAFVNAGIYLMQKEVLELIPEDVPYSLEYELFSALCKKRFYGFLTNEELIDIGTPARYREAEEKILRWRR